MQQTVEKIIKKSVSGILPDNEINDLIECINTTMPPSSIRLNHNKIKTHTLNKKIPWSKYGYYLDERPAFTYDPFLHAGVYYVQEASSMFIEEILRQLNGCNSPVKILDLCAAPGGKSTLISSLIHPDSVLVSNEIDKHRCNILVENVIKWGNDNTLVSNNKPGDFCFLKNYFDIILADLPCSGEGMFRKDKNSIIEWSEKNVNDCSSRQKKISDDILQTLKPGGYYIYSTCTFNKIENEENIDYLVKKHDLKSIELNNNSFMGIYHTRTKYGAHGYRFFPNKIKGEGFFVSILQKKQSTYKPQKINHAQKFKAAKNISSKICEQYEINVIEKKLLEINTYLYAVNESVIKTSSELLINIKLIHIPTALFEIKKSDYIPTQAFANAVFNKNKTKNLHYEDAINYLMGMNVNLDINNGFSAVSYKSAKLGWVKKIDARINNYYPKEWRIRHPNKSKNNVLLSNYIEIK